MKEYSISIIKTMKEKKALIKELTENIRQIDAREMEGMGFTTKEGVEMSIKETSPVYAGRTIDGKLAICWGLQILMGQGHTTYLIWALGTDELDNHRKAFVQESRAIIERWVNLYGCLENTVATFNKRAIRWLKWLGAEFSEPYKIKDTEYVNFWIRRKEC